VPLRHNGGMTSAFDIRSTAGRFRLVALAEAVSWVGLLVGMYFKYLGSPRTEIGVKVFGMAHGLVFIAFVITALLAGIAYKWGVVTWLLALLGSIVPLGSVIFLIWADRTAKLGGGRPVVASPQPRDSAATTT
jgi:integral membrane protein